MRARCELPHLSRLRLLAGSAHKLVNTSQWNEVSVRLSAKDRRRLDSLLETGADAPTPGRRVTQLGGTGRAGGMADRKSVV